MAFYFKGKKVSVRYGDVGGTSDHSLLTNRDAADQHPIGAVTGLTKELERIPEPAEALTNEELEGIFK